MDRVRMPTLAQVFQLARSAGNTEVRFNIEIKTSPEKPGDTLAPEAFARALLATIEREGMSSRVIIQSFDWRALKAVQALSPAIPTSYLSSQQRLLDNIAAGKAEGSAWTAGVQFRDHGSIPKMVKAAGGAIWSPYYPELSADLVKEAHALGLKVIPWTANKTEDMARATVPASPGRRRGRPSTAGRCARTTACRRYGSEIASFRLTMLVISNRESFPNS